MAARPFLKSIVSNEAADAIGSGNTAPDIVFGPHGACVRSERTGGGAGRSYTVVVEASDSHGNSTQRSVEVIVPHDMGGHPGCVRATGLAATDLRCVQ